MKNLILAAAAVSLSIAATGAVAQQPDGIEQPVEARSPAAHYWLGGSSQMSVNVGGRRKAEIREILMPVAASRMVPHERLLGVDLARGATAPREKVRIRRLPAEIVGIAPEYSRYEYFVVDDGMIVIVNPRTYEIVDVLPG